MRTYLLLVLGLVFSSAHGAEFRYKDLEKLIRDNHVATVDALLPLLPEDYRRNYIFVYQSRSQQKDNVFPDHPRIILTGADARFVMALTKSPSEAPKVDIDDTIETIEFDDKTAKFSFRELKFKNGQDPLNPPPAVNPATCLACHGADPRPNWESYNVWPGVYGSVSRLGCDTANVHSAEADFYKNFLSKERDRGRYAFLPKGTRDGSCPDKDDITITNGASSDANANFTEHLFDMNSLRLKRLLHENKRFETFQYLWAGAARDCLEKDPEGFFPPNYAKDRGLPSYAETLDSVISISRAEFKRRLNRFSQTSAGSATESLRQPINFLDPQDTLGGSYSHRFDTQKLRFLTERTGINMAIDRWATGFTDGTLDFATPHSYPGRVLYTLADDLARGLSCDELKKKSVEAIAALH